jgi:alpha-L-arabinofuranosidase
VQIYDYFRTISRYLYEMKVIKAAFLIILFFSSYTYAQSGNKITVQVNNVIKNVSPLMTGACIEDVNHEIYGGIYSQMIFGESFQELPMHISSAINPEFAGLSGWLSCKAPRDQHKDESEIRSWQPVKTGTATGAFSIDSIQPFVGKQSQTISFINGAGTIGIENRGLNRQGLSLSGKQVYEGTICAKTNNPVQVYISLQSEDGSITYAETAVMVTEASWAKYDFTLTPTKSAIHARLCISLHQKGKVSLGYVFMQPGAWGRFKDLPVRKDVAEGLIKGNITVLRYGGSMTLADNYRWKNMIGAREKRPPYKGTWYPYSSNGWGIIDFLDLCEATNITAIPDFSTGETPQDMADFVDYVNGNGNTHWGRKRTTSGHKASYHLKYIELGNEQFNNQKLTDRFKLLADAIWSKDPTIQIIFCFSDDTHEDLSGDLAYIKQTIEHCQKTGHTAWFDVHIFNDTEKQPDLKDFEFAEEQLRSVAPDSTFKLCIFEENAENARMKRALAHANAINRLQRIKYDVPIVCAANGMQVEHQNDNGWDQGLLFFNPKYVWGQPSYYVTKMVAENYLPQVVESEFSSKSDTLDITSRKSEDGKTVTIQIVNSKGNAVNADVQLNDYNGTATKVMITELKANSLDDWNTVDEPFKILPVKNEIESNNGGCNYTFAPYSFTILKFEQ